MNRDNRPTRFTRRVIAAAPGDEEWFTDRLHRCVECQAPFFVAEAGGRPPACCSPECWQAHNRRLSRESMRRRRAG